MKFSGQNDTGLWVPPLALEELGMGVHRYNFRACVHTDTQPCTHRDAHTDLHTTRCKPFLKKVKGQLISFGSIREKK